MPCCLNVSRVAGSPMLSAVYITKLYHRSDGACLQFIIPHLSSLPHLPGHSGLRRSAMISPSFQAQVHQVSSFWEGIWQDHLQSMTPLLPWSSKPSLEPCFQWWSSSCLPSVTRLQKFCDPSSDHPPWIPIELGRTEKLNKVVLRMVKFPHLPNLARSFWLFRAAEVCCAAPASCSTKQRSQRLTHTDTHTRGRYFESKTQYQVLHYSDYLDVVGWQKIM